MDRFATYAEARAFADNLRRIFAGLDVSIKIERPLFDGDDFRVYY